MFYFCFEVMKTFSIKAADVKRDWLLIDANGKTLGRLATEIALRLRGKHKAEYTPHIDNGDYIIVINAGKIHTTGNKLENKIYHHHTGYVGHLKSINLKDLKFKAPEQPLKIAVRGMLPKGPLGRAMLKKLKIFAGNEHTHNAQQPKPLAI